MPYQTEGHHQGNTRLSDITRQHQTEGLLTYIPDWRVHPIIHQTGSSPLYTRLRDITKATPDCETSPRQHQTERHHQGNTKLCDLSFRHQTVGSISIKHKTGGISIRNQTGGHVYYTPDWGYISIIYQMGTSTLYTRLGDIHYTPDWGCISIICQTGGTFPLYTRWGHLHYIPDWGISIIHQTGGAFPLYTRWGTSTLYTSLRVHLHYMQDWGTSPLYTRLGDISIIHQTGRICIIHQSGGGSPRF